MSNVREFIDNLDENIMKLGLNSKFKEHPAYQKVLDEIRYYISGMNMANDVDKAWVLKDENGYTIDYKSPYVEKKYNLQICVSNDKNELFCREMIESKNLSETRDYVEKTVEVTRSRLDGDCIIISNNNNEKNTQKFLFEDGEMKKEYNNNKTTIFDKIIEQLL